MIVEIANNHFFDLRNITEIQFHEQDYSIHYRNIGSSTQVYVPLQEEGFTQLRSAWAAYSESENTRRNQSAGDTPWNI